MKKDNKKYNNYQNPMKEKVSIFCAGIIIIALLVTTTVFVVYTIIRLDFWL